LKEKDHTEQLDTNFFLFIYDFQTQEDSGALKQIGNLAKFSKNLIG
jgi:hypothetical protein